MAAARPRPRKDLIAALDVGTTKVACVIAREEEDGALRVLGVGHHRSRGLRNGQVANIDEAEASIRAAVDAAEQMANTRVEKVLVTLSGGQPRSRMVNVRLAVGGQAVRDQDVRRILEQGRAQHVEPDRDLIHCIPTSYSIDGTDGVVDPRGMFTEQLGVQVHLITAAAGSARNLTTAVERGDLDVEARVAAPYAAGLACLVEDEKQLGATCIDMGGGTTSIAVFSEGQLMHVDVLPIGGNHVTSDIAKGLSTPVAAAERLKTIHGSCMASPADARELLKVALVGEEDEANHAEIPRSMLIQIIRPRLEEVFEMVRARLEDSGAARLTGRRVVLTGGASLLQGVRELGEIILDKQVRLGRPSRLKGLPESTSGAAFAAAAGLVRFAVLDHVESPEDPRGEPVERGGTFGRIGRWLKENF